MRAFTLLVLFAITVILTTPVAEAKSSDIFAVDLAVQETLLDGHQLTYQYQNGDAIAAKFDNGAISYQWLTGRNAGKPIKTLPYSSRKLGSDQYLVAWHEPEVNNYITIYLDLSSNTMASSVIVRYKNEKPIFSFQGGIIENFSSK